MSIIKNKKIFLIFFGPPGSGKGTQAEMLAKKIGLPVVSTGALLRHEIISCSELGKKVKPLLDNGRLVDDKIVGEIIAKRLKRDDARGGVIFDGYPRKIEQLEFLLFVLNQISGKEENSARAILINVSDEEARRRLGGRRSCDCGASYHIIFKLPRRDNICDKCGRKLFIRNDSKKQVIQERLHIYHQWTNPILDYFRENGKLIEINGEQRIKKVHEDIGRKLKIVIGNPEYSGL